MKKRRGRKPKSLILTRDFSKNEIFLLEYLWRWKVAPASLLKEAAFRKSSPWTFYKILKRLIKEKILMEIPGGKYFSHRLLALTEFGFEIYLRDLDYINRFRFRVHAPAHDYLATALQLGDFVFPPDLGMQRLSEQKLQTFLPEQLPYGFQRLHTEFQEGYGGSKSHIPDGLTVFSNKGNRIVVGYEVEINLKPEERYRALFSYWDSYDGQGRHIAADIVFVLVRTQWIASKIISYIGESSSRLEKYAFVSMEEFIEKGWQAEVKMGLYQGESIRKIHENLLQKLGKDISKIGQTPLWEMFFPKYRSPQKSIAYRKSELTPQD